MRVPAKLLGHKAAVGGKLHRRPAAAPAPGSRGLFKEKSQLSSENFVAPNFERATSLPPAENFSDVAEKLGDKSRNLSLLMA